MAKYLKKAERKKQLKDAAIALIERNGYQNTSVQDIVDKANTSKGGFYNCYASKADLYKDIIDDGCTYRYDEMVSYNKANQHLDKKTLLVEMLLDKIISYNKYKKLYAMLLKEMGADQDLSNYYKDGTIVAQNMFIEFCQNEGFIECVKLNNKQFEAFINSIIVGVDMFDLYDSETYRDMLRTMITAYFEKIALLN